MGNRLRMALIETIITLRRRGWSRRRIARELGVDRETVTRHLRGAAEASNATIAPSGSESVEAESNATNAPPGSSGPEGGADAASAPLGDAGRSSECEPFRAVIVAAWERDLSAQRIYQDLVGEHGFVGSYYSVRRFVRRLGRRAELPVRRMECEAGDEVQVDFGRGAPIIMPDGRRRLTHVFRVTGQSYRLRNQTRPTGESAEESKPANAPSGSKPIQAGSKPAKAPPGADGEKP
jgi:hypothetical protein